MHKVFFIMIILMAASPAFGAPIWLERQFAPKAELLDPSFTAHNDAAETRIDHDAWTEFLASYVARGPGGVNRVDYAAVTPADREALDDYIALLSVTNISELNRKEQLALWINLYNAATLALALDHYPVKSIQKIDNAWDKPVVSIDGRSLTLNDIEHRIVRPVFNDARIHYAMNCAATGCPNLRLTAYEGDDLDAALDEAARGYVNDRRGVTVDGGKIIVSKIYGWYREDFGDGEEGVLDHLRRYASPSLKAALKGADDIDKYVYDWSLNDRQ